MMTQTTPENSPNLRENAVAITRPPTHQPVKLGLLPVDLVEHNTFASKYDIIYYIHADKTANS